MEYREIFLTLLRKYDETKQPHSYLKDLVESTHLFLRMLERFCKGRKNLIVQVSCSLFLVVFWIAWSVFEVLMFSSFMSSEKEGQAEEVSR